METSYCLGEQTLILCLDTKQGFSWLPLTSISSINATHVWIYDSVKQPKKQWEIFHIIISCRGGFREGSVFWPELKEQSRSPWGTQTGLAGAIFLLCISCVESYLKNFQLFFFFFPFWKMPIHENQQVSWEYAGFLNIFTVQKSKKQMVMTRSRNVLIFHFKLVSFNISSCIKI